MPPPFFFLANGMKLAMLNHMKYSRYISVLVVTITLLGQGLLPGVILCRGEEGHCAVETTFDVCCFSPVQASIPSFLFLSADDMEYAEHSACGPCSDTFVTTNPFEMPSPRHESNLGPAHRLIVPANRVAFEAARLFVSTIDPSQLALIPVKTTFLLL